MKEGIVSPDPEKKQGILLPILYVHSLRCSHAAKKIKATLVLVALLSLDTTVLAGCRPEITSICIHVTYFSLTSRSVHFEFAYNP